MNSFKSPIKYVPDFLAGEADTLFDHFMNIEWDERTAARREAFYSTVGKDYTYGSGEYARTYSPRNMMLEPTLTRISLILATKFRISESMFELCFLNRYENERQQLGWHADDDTAIDHNRPIAVVSLGAERELWVKPIGGTHEDVEKIRLAHGSLLLMLPGMQQTHYHRIPKHDRPCGPRISLTYRGFKA